MSEVGVPGANHNTTAGARKDGRGRTETKSEVRYLLFHASVHLQGGRHSEQLKWDAGTNTTCVCAVTSCTEANGVAAGIHSEVLSSVARSQGARYDLDLWTTTPCALAFEPTVPSPVPARSINVMDLIVHLVPAARIWPSDPPRTKWAAPWPYQSLNHTNRMTPS